MAQAFIIRRGGNAKETEKVSDNLVLYEFIFVETRDLLLIDSNEGNYGVVVGE